MMGTSNTDSDNTRCSMLRSDPPPAAGKVSDYREGEALCIIASSASVVDKKEIKYLCRRIKLFLTAEKGAKWGGMVL